MKKTKYQVIAAIFMVLLISFWASNFSGAEVEGKFDAKTREKMEKSLDKAMEKSRSPAVVAAVWVPGKGTSCLTSDGVPYVIDSFKLKGYAGSNDYLVSRLESREPVEVQPSDSSGKRTHEMPADVAVVEFPLYSGRHK